MFDIENLPLAPTVWRKIAAVNSPLLTTLHFTPRGRRDKAVAAASNALAVAYFDIFGLCDE